MLVFNDIDVFNNDFNIGTIDNSKISFVYLNEDRVVSILVIIVSVFDQRDDIKEVFKSSVGLKYFRSYFLCLVFSISGFLVSAYTL